MSLSLSSVKIKLSPSLTATCPSLHVKPLQHTIICGLNGSGKSVFAEVLAQQGVVVCGERNVEGSVGWVSVALQQAIIDAERKKDDADILDVIPQPSTALDVIAKGRVLSHEERATLAALAELLGIVTLLERDFLALSTGETRKVLLAQQLLLKPDWLILDEPYDGLDVQTVAKFSAYLTELAKTCTVIMVVNRVSEIPSWACKLLFFEQYKIAWQSEGRPLNDAAYKQLLQILHMHHNVEALPSKDEGASAPALNDSSAPLVELIDGRVAWGDNLVFSNLNWRILPGEHWQIVGPNGSGKTCLLTLITGDNPLCYSNNLTVFGYKRGSGESIWDIKQHLGLVSNSFHLQYRVNCTALDVVCSGFYDSIGLYNKPTELQKTLAYEWLATIGLIDSSAVPFQSFSFGDQRLILIARAMVKHPSLLILDEPCNGLDEVNRLKVLTMIELITREGQTTLLYVNHHSEDKIGSIAHCLNMEDF